MTNGMLEKKNSLVSCVVDDPLKCLLQYKYPQRSRAQDLGVWGWGVGAGVLLTSMGIVRQRAGNTHRSVKTDCLESETFQSELAGRGAGTLGEPRSRTVFEYKRCLPHRV